MAQAEDTMHRNVSQKLVTIMIEMNRNGFPSVVDFFDEDEARAISSEEAKRRVVNAAVESGGVIPVSILSFNGALHATLFTLFRSWRLLSDSSRVGTSMIQNTMLRYLLCVNIVC